MEELNNINITFKVIENQNYKEIEVKENSHYTSILPNSIIPDTLKDNQEFMNLYNEIFTQEVKAKYQECLDSLKPSQEELRKNEYESKLAQINAKYVNSINELSRGVPNTERETWTKQEQEAKDLLNGSTNILMLSALAKAREIPIEYLASKVIEKANVYAMIVGELTGNRQKQEDLLKEEYKDIL